MKNNLKILTQNLRCIDDGIDNTIEKRSLRFKDLLNKYQPDIIGTQEISTRWYNEISKLNNDYGIVGISRLGYYSPIPMNSDESNLILYKLTRFELIKQNTFWLSNTTDIVSKYPESKYTRICTYAVLLDKLTNKEILFCNTHLDHEENDEIRVKQAKVLENFIKEKLNDNVTIILTGDFNTEKNSESYKIVNNILKDSIIAAKNLSNVDYSYHEYGNVKAFKTIDYCFYNEKDYQANTYYIINDDFDGYVSDHYGVLVEFLKK